MTQRCDARGNSAETRRSGVICGACDQPPCDQPPCDQPPGVNNSVVLTHRAAVRAACCRFPGTSSSASAPCHRSSLMTMTQHIVGRMWCELNSRSLRWNADGTPLDSMSYGSPIESLEVAMESRLHMMDAGGEHGTSSPGFAAGCDHLHAPRALCLLSDNDRSAGCCGAGPREAGLALWRPGHAWGRSG